MGNKKGSFVGLLPLIIFVILYIISTILTGNASTMPLNTGILIAIICAFVFCAMRKKDENTMSFDDLVTSFCKGGGDDTLILMFFIFLEAGIFSGVANAMGAVSSASNLGLKLLPASMVLPGIFIIGCVLSFAMGTSMGTVSALMPIGIQIANVTGMSMPMVCGAVVGGAMFGDNLSFISDTTIAATRTQGVAMKDKFKANFLMVLPAVIINIVLLFFNSSSTALDESALTWDFIQLIPYILVIVLSLIGINVILAMGAGIAAGLIIGIAQGSFSLAESLTVVGNGIISMEDTAVIAVMVGGLVALMHYLGGIQWLLNSLSRSVKSRSGAELSIAALVTLLDLATTNNTISIITAGPIAKDISQKYGVSPVRAASILDLFSSAGNGVCPWAGQILAASGLAGVSTLSIVPFCWYSIMMFIFGVIFILIGWPKGIVKNTEQAPAAK
ncbi:Na+/H+ antiporter NhaC family protein [Oscillibacter valericigenes]|uniref:Na+/H+ antiporter NhaC family protein n=1 Tax=Oscillibacter valericigenes TaxID=351091 RepID=A0ABS2FUC1_9FIRM|nr:Na+/H+ antiporter NhaC family protein [Oscillibacter valericigenes]MBM6850671.1 Na+/H+ antiporter NhaC family protein [Oscillibacter valericigenes]MBM6909142.1 Na+/H+ antiporter NhaC family protein [Oscillibacter valericigenes]HJB76701.1 Na+/H+ antiporter NhaC family protein [Candidatus Oscillibacter avistercoris]